MIKRNSYTIQHDIARHDSVRHRTANKTNELGTRHIEWDSELCSMREKDIKRERITLEQKQKQKYKF